MQDINYDDVLLSKVATITLHGKKYEIQEPTLGVILAFERERKKMAGVKDITKVATQIVRIIRTVYNTVPEKAFEGFAPKALYRILVDVSKVINENMLPESTNEGKKAGTELTDGKTPKKKLTVAS